MKPVGLWVAAAVLAVGALYLLVVYIPHGGSRVATEGLKAEGQVLMKDSRPSADGGKVYTVRFVYADANHVNHDVTNTLTDIGLWDRLQPDQYIQVRYLPANPDRDAYIEGSQGGATPHAAALRFIAWTALLAAMVCGYLAIRGAGTEPRPEDGRPRA